MEKNQNKTAYCIITYNHPEIIRDVLNQIASTFLNYGIDIYFYDSSEKNDTLDVVNEFIDHGFDNLYYIKIDSSIGPSLKLLKIFTGFGLQKAYDYIWPAKDRSIFREDLLQTVSHSMIDGYDAIFLGVAQHPAADFRIQNYHEEYQSREEFFADWSWLSTSVDVTIYRYDTLLKGLDADELLQRYLDGKISSFIHSAILFHTLASLENPKIKVLYGEHIVCHNSSLGHSSWNNEIFKLWADVLVKTIEALPSCYDLQKERVIKKIGMLPWIFGSHDQMVYEREQNILTEQVFEEIKDVWGRLSDIPLSELQLIAEKKYDLLFQVIFSKMESAFDKKQYGKFYDVFIRNSWIKSIWGAQNYNIVKNCVEIFNMEKEANINQDIFAVSKSIANMVDLYKIMTNLINELVADEEESTFMKVLSYKNNNRISMKFFAFLVVNESNNPQLIMEKLEEFTKTH